MVRAKNKVAQNMYQRIKAINPKEEIKEVDKANMDKTSNNTNRKEATTIRTTKIIIRVKVEDIIIGKEIKAIR